MTLDVFTKTSIDNVMFNIIHGLIKQVCLPRPVNVLQHQPIIKLRHGWPQSF